MAERRMFAKGILTSDAFLDMPSSAQSLYVLLGMMADDDGFVNNPGSILRMSGGTFDDLKLLTAKGFLISFESGVVVLRHWHVHNSIKKDRYRPTRYLEEKQQLQLDASGNYILLLIPLQPEQNCSEFPLDPQVRSGEKRSEKFRKDESAAADSGSGFSPPSLEEVKAFCLERSSSVDPVRFHSYYASNGWMVGKTPMMDWQAALRGWEANAFPCYGKKEPIHGCTGLGAAELEAIQQVLQGGGGDAGTP